MALPLGRKLPLLISGLILLVLLASSGAAYLEVERSSTTTADDRVTSLAQQLAEMVRVSVVQRGVMMRRVAADSAVKRLLLSPGTGTLDASPGVNAALERLVVPTDSDGLIEIWDQSGHPRARFVDGLVTPQDDAEDPQRAMLISRESQPTASPLCGGTSSIRTAGCLMAPLFPEIRS